MPAAVVFGDATLASFAADAPRRTLTATPAVGMPPSDSLPFARVGRRLRLFLPFFTDVLRVRPTGSETSERVSNVPARLTVPFPGLYGVKSDSQRSAPPAAGVLKIPFTVNFASSTWAPFAERPGVPIGTSGGGRQMLSLYAPSACSAPAVGLTYSGRAIVWPATLRLRIQTAALVPTRRTPSSRRRDSTGRR